MLIYKATSPSGKSYIGQTSLSFKLRKQCHYNAYISAKRYKKFNVVFYNAIMKYGWDKIQWKIIEDGINNQDVLNEKELFYIKEHNCFFPLGYNMTIGSVGCKGYKHTRKHKNKMKKLFKNRKFTEEWKRRISETNKTNPPFLNKKHTNEWKEKIKKINLKNRISKKCLCCGVNFLGLKSKNYCSDKCRHRSRYLRRIKNGYYGS